MFVDPRVAGDVSGLQVDPGTEFNLQIRGRAIKSCGLKIDRPNIFAELD